MRALRELAALYGLQASYQDDALRRRRASADALLAVLRSLGAPLDGLPGAPEAVRARRLEVRRRPLEPVVVAWNGALRDVPLRLPAGQTGGPVRCSIELEDGEEWGSWETDLSSNAPAEDVEGTTYVLFSLTGPRPLPFGYHVLSVEAGGSTARATVVSAPIRCFSGREERTWGLFLPLYALRSQRSLGVADLTDLGAVAEWVGGLGGRSVATLPLLAAFLDEPYEASPYSPASRLFWNELYVDPTALPEFERSSRARGLVRLELRRELDDLLAQPLLDYRRTAAIKRRILEALADTFFSDPSWRRDAFEGFLRANPGVLDYARFRSACERHGLPWPRWPTSERGGVVPAHADDPASRYHLYVQWAASEQLEQLVLRARAAGTGLFFDLPLGVNAAGYDTWRERDAFLTGLSTGAPPDAFFHGGQDWGFPPLSPEGIRGQAYRYPIACLRHLMRHAAALRLDHVMGLHRLFVIPKGMSASSGVYLRYRPDEWYSIIALESHRTRTVVVGEDLGIVPAYVRSWMARHGIRRTYLFQFEVSNDRRRAIRRPPRDSTAALGSHDSPTLAAFLNGLDLDFALSRGWIDEAGGRAGHVARTRLRRALQAFLGARAELPEDPDEDRALLRGVLRHLANSEAGMLLVNLEDLWLETERQNLPGTVQEYPNWRRRARHPLESFRSMPEVVGTLREVDAVRRQGS